MTTDACVHPSDGTQLACGLGMRMVILAVLFTTQAAHAAQPQRPAKEHAVTRSEPSWKLVNRAIRRNDHLEAKRFSFAKVRPRLRAMQRSEQVEWLSGTLDSY